MADKLTVLVVDDEKEIREIAKFWFAEHGFEVLEAASGSEAFEVVKGGKVDVVVSDVRMPGGTGIELLENVQSMEGSRPPVILVSGYSDTSPEEAEEMGAARFFSKPVEYPELLEFVKGLVSGA